MEACLRQEIEACLFPQVLLEFVAVATSGRRPARVTPEQAWDWVDGLRSRVPVLDVSEESVDRVSELHRQHPRQGGRVFDLFLVAQMRAAGISEICTDNVRDLRGFGVEVLTPEVALERVGRRPSGRHRGRGG